MPFLELPVVGNEVCHHRREAALYDCGQTSYSGLGNTFWAHVLPCSVVLL